MSAATVRSFVALEIPSGIRAELGAAIGRLRVELPRARWVRPEGVHLTLKFLGESQRGQLESLAGDLRARLAGRGPVPVELAGAGFFPGPARPRVAWIGGRAEGATELAGAVDAAATELGWERERRPWSLHLTVARIDRPWPRSAVERYLAWGEGMALPHFECPEAVLFESRLGPGGAVYTALERFPLA